MYQYYSSCVDWPHNTESLHNIIQDSIDITRKTFLKHINKMDILDMEKGLGYVKHYKQGLIMAKDYHVSYYRSKFKNKTIYYFTHSAIEYIFTKV